MKDHPDYGSGRHLAVVCSGSIMIFASAARLVIISIITIIIQDAYYCSGRQLGAVYSVQQTEHGSIMIFASAACLVIISIITTNLIIIRAIIMFIKSSLGY